MCFAAALPNALCCENTPLHRPQQARVVGACNLPIFNQTLILRDCLEALPSTLSLCDGPVAYPLRCHKITSADKSRAQNQAKPTRNLLWLRMIPSTGFVGTRDFMALERICREKTERVGENLLGIS